MGIAAESRRNYILHQLHKNGVLHVSQVAGTLNVSKVNIRRDLTFLKKQGLLKKTYGGAVLTSPDVEPSVRYRQTKKISAKKIVSELAGTLIDDGDVIYLEAGSTCNEIIPFLAKKNNLTVIVNSLYLMRRLAKVTGHKIIVVGGQYRPETMDTVGPGAETAIAQLGGFKAFTGADDITIDSGISGKDVVTVGFARLVLKRADKVIFVGDNTKFDNPALYKIADLDQLDYIVTNTAPSKPWQLLAKKKHIKLIYPK